jgi:hypothetical protein
VTQDERPGQDGVSDARIGIPVEIGTTDAYRRHADEFVTRTGTGRGLVHETEVTGPIQPQ